GRHGHRCSTEGTSSRSLPGAAFSGRCTRGAGGSTRPRKSLRQCSRQKRSPDHTASLGHRPGRRSTVRCAELGLGQI
ncbi:uncharacterized protein METZ01_LOCUS443422, partial [marine metagenome]